MNAIVGLLDKACNAAWDSRTRALAITNARMVFAESPAHVAAAALACWREAVGYDGPDDGFVAFLNIRYRDRGDIALSLMRAALIAEQKHAARREQAA